MSTNFLKYAILSLPLSLMLAACSDDDKYTAGALSPGAYFPTDAPATVELTLGESSVNVPIYRTEGNGTETYQISVDEEAGIFQGPTNVTFEGSSLVANIVFTYDPEYVVADQLYPCTISVAKESTTIYGLSEYEFAFKLLAPTIREFVGKGLYTYNAAFTGHDPGLDCYKVSTEGNTETYKFEVEHWLGDVTLNIIVDYSVTLTNEGHPAYVMEQSTGYFDAEVGEIMALDYDTYLRKIGKDPGEGYYSWYVPTTGCFTLGMMYLAPSYNGTNGLAAGFETFQLDGFPNYEVSVTYDGLVNDADAYQTSVLATVTSGEDVEKVRVAVFSGSYDSTMLDLIDQDAVDYVTVIGEGTTQTAKIGISGAGSYTLVAASYGEGEQQDYSYVEFTADKYVVEQGVWEEVGTGVFVDGFIIPFFGYTNSNGNFVGLNPFELAYDVTIQKEVSGTHPNIYRLLYPYGPTSDNYITVNLNTTPENSRCISFDMTDDQMISFAFQNTGFTYQSRTFYLCDGTWEGKRQGYSNSYIKRNKLNSYYDSAENCVYIQSPRLANNSNPDKLENPNSYNYPAIIYMPDGYAQAKANLAAIRMVTQPNLPFSTLIGESSVLDHTVASPAGKTFIALDKAYAPIDSKMKVYEKR